MQSTSEPQIILLPYAALIISMDLAGHLAKEIGIDKFISDELRSLTRIHLAEAFQMDTEITRDKGTELECFIAAVRGAMGARVANSFLVWHRGVVSPPHAVSAKRFLWSILIKRLRDDWENLAPSLEVPVSRAELVHSRLAAQEFIEGLQRSDDRLNLLLEVNQSDWDNRIVAKCEFEEQVLESIYWDFILMRSSAEFWPQWLHSLPELEQRALHVWGRSVAAAEKMPLRYVRLPS